MRGVRDVREITTRVGTKKQNVKSLVDRLRCCGTRQNGNLESYRGCSAFDACGGLEPSGKFQLPLGSPSERHVRGVLFVAEAGA
jgi:hypothetical protein